VRKDIRQSWDALEGNTRSSSKYLARGRSNALQKPSTSRKFHEMLKNGEIDKATVDEFDKASKGLSLPKKVKKNPGYRAG